MNKEEIEQRQNSIESGTTEERYRAITCCALGITIAILSIAVCIIALL